MVNLFSDRDSSPFFFFSEKEKQQIQQAVQIAEQKTSSEIRVHVERRKEKHSLMKQAGEAFERIGMTATNQRNGVLIFICSDSREFVVLGDELLHKELPADFWNEIVKGMEVHFRANRFADGIAEAILKTGEKIKEYFPAHPDDKNELPDDISVD